MYALLASCLRTHLSCVVRLAKPALALESFINRCSACPQVDPSGFDAALGGANHVVGVHINTANGVIWS